MNEWPDGQRHPMSQSEHEQWNQTHSPGTRQCCDRCGEFTGRCEEDSLYADSGLGPLCEDCYKETVSLSDIRIAILRNGATSEMDAVLDELTRLRAENEKLRAFVEDSFCECYDEYGLKRLQPCDRCKLLGIE